MDDMPEILGKLVAEMREVGPLFESQIDEADAQLSTLSEQSLTGEAYARTQLPIEITSEASKKILQFLNNNLFYLETVSILGITRYLFELHVWLKSIERHKLRSVEFFTQIFEDQEKHITKYIERLNAEANFFDEIQKEDGLPDSLINLAQSDPKQLTAEFVRAEVAKKEAIVDLKARRKFALYRRAATINGYGFQAHLIRKEVVKTARDQLDQLLVSKVEFETRVTKQIIDLETLNSSGRRKRWNWRDEAASVGMIEAYDFIYGYTSRLMHATPTSIYTVKKNLEMEEMETFLEFCYVTLLDLVEVATSIRRG